MSSPNSGPGLGERKKCIVLALGGAEPVKEHSAPLWEVLESHADVVFVEHAGELAHYIEMSEQMRVTIHSVILSDPTVYINTTDDPVLQYFTREVVDRYVNGNGTVIMCSLFVKGIQADPHGFETFMKYISYYDCKYVGNVLDDWRIGTGHDLLLAHRRTRNSPYVPPRFRMEAAALSSLSMPNARGWPVASFVSDNPGNFSVACWDYGTSALDLSFGRIAYVGDLHCTPEGTQVILALCDHSDQTLGQVSAIRCA